MRYIITPVHGESASVFHVVDTWQPESEQPAVIRSWITSKDPNARWLADDFVRRHNGKDRVSPPRAVFAGNDPKDNTAYPCPWEIKKS